MLADANFHSIQSEANLLKKLCVVTGKFCLMPAAETDYRIPWSKVTSTMASEKQFGIPKKLCGRVSGILANHRLKVPNTKRVWLMSDCTVKIFSHLQRDRRLRVNSACMGQGRCFQTFCGKTGPQKNTAGGTTKPVVDTHAEGTSLVSSPT